MANISKAIALYADGQVFYSHQCHYDKPMNLKEIVTV